MRLKAYTFKDIPGIAATAMHGPRTPKIEA
jgi:hypothetical protein